MTLPTEAFEMKWLMDWARIEHMPPDYWRGTRRKYGDFLFHVPNEGKRSIAGGRMLKAGGMQRGVPDLFFAVPVTGEHAAPGLFIELKSTRKGARTTPEQDEWLDRLDAQGYGVAVCRGWQEAADRLTSYLVGRPGRQERGQ